MLVTSVAISLSFLALHSEQPIRRAAGLSGSLANILVVWIMLAAPTGRLESGRSRWAIVIFGAVVIAAATIADLNTRRVAWAFGVAVSLGLAWIVARRWVKASGPTRRSLGPIVLAGIVTALVHALDFAAGVLLIQVTSGSLLQLADTWSRAIVPYGFLLGLLRLRMTRGAVVRLVVELGDGLPPERLRSALASALGDRTLDVLYWSEPAGGYVDGQGERVDLTSDSSGRAVTFLEREGRPLAAMLHDPALADDPGLVTAVSSAVRLAVENERLAEEVRAQLGEVRASRARIVEAADAERRRVERNLHDGAQQRLVALSMAIRRARAQLPADAASETATTLDAAAEQLREALAELRSLARGIHPAVLTEAGLAAALRVLARESSVSATVDADLPDDLPDAVAAAAYFVAAESLTNAAKYAEARHVTIQASVEDQVLHIAVSDDGRGGADPSVGSGLRGLGDRVAALGGHLDVHSPPGSGTRVEARLPLEAPSD
jgi:signal transduction histidine kinase